MTWYISSAPHLKRRQPPSMTAAQRRANRRILVRGARFRASISTTGCPGRRPVRAQAAGTEAPARRACAGEVGVHAREAQLQRGPAAALLRQRGARDDRQVAVPRAWRPKAGDDLQCAWAVRVKTAGGCGLAVTPGLGTGAQPRRAGHGAVRGRARATVCGPRACSARQAASASRALRSGMPVSCSASNWFGVSTLASGTSASRYVAAAPSGTYRRPSSPMTGSHTARAAACMTACHSMATQRSSVVRVRARHACAKSAHGQVVVCPCMHAAFGVTKCHLMRLSALMPAHAVAQPMCARCHHECSTLSSEKALYTGGAHRTSGWGCAAVANPPAARSCSAATQTQCTLHRAHAYIRSSYELGVAQSSRRRCAAGSQ